VGKRGRGPKGGKVDSLGTFRGWFLTTRGQAKKTERKRETTKRNGNVKISLSGTSNMRDLKRRIVEESLPQKRKSPIVS